MNGPDAASDVNGSWASASAVNEANMAAAEQAFQQAQQDVANSIATAMEGAQQSVAAAMSATGPAGN